MVVIWGAPSTYTGTASNISYSECVDNCYGYEKCAIAYFVNESCYNFDYGVVSSVEQLEKDSNEIVAFKTNSTSCPTSPSSIYYSLNYKIENSGSVWKFTQYLKCATNWFLSNRPEVTWCIRFFYNASLVTYSQVVNYCADNSATLSGIATADEYNFVVETSHAYTPINVEKVRIDGHLNNNCVLMINEKNTNGTCYFPKSWTFSDTYFSSFDQYNWYPGNPDAQLQNGLYQQTIVIHSRVGDVLDGYFDDWVAEAPTRMYICGKLATSS